MRQITTLLILASALFAQAPGNWGPGGIPTDWRGSGIEWMESGKFTSPSATSYQYFASSAAADSLVWVQTQAAGDNDMVLKFVEDDGTAHNFYWDDALVAFNADERIYVTGTKNFTVYGGSTNLIRMQIDTDGQLVTNGIDMMLDPNLAGASTLQLGETGDHDINYLNGRLQTNITTVDSTYVMGAADGYMFTMTANDTLKCPVTPLAGEVLECKFTNASGGVLSGNGQTIDGAATVAASENDNIRIVWNATASDWEVR